MARFLPAPGVGSIRFTFVGFLTGVAAATFVDLWPWGVSVPAIPAIPGPLEIVSSSAVDSNALGTGACTVRVHYLDAAGDWYYADFNMNGVTPVPLGLTTTQIMYAEVVSGTVAVGNIDVRIIASGAAVTRIRAEYAQAQTLSFKVPTGYKCKIVEFKTQAASTALSSLEAVLVSDVRKDGVITAGLWTTHGSQLVALDNVIDTIDTIFPAGSVVRVRVRRMVGTATVTALCRMTVEFQKA